MPRRSPAPVRHAHHPRPTAPWPGPPDRHPELDRATARRPPNPAGTRRQRGAGGLASARPPGQRRAGRPGAWRSGGPTGRARRRRTGWTGRCACPRMAGGVGPADRRAPAPGAGVVPGPVDRVLDGPALRQPATAVRPGHQPAPPPRDPAHTADRRRVRRPVLVGSPLPARAGLVVPAHPELAVRRRAARDARPTSTWSWISTSPTAIRPGRPSSPRRSMPGCRAAACRPWRSATSPTCTRR